MARPTRDNIHATMHPWTWNPHFIIKNCYFFFWDTIRTKPLMNFRKNNKNIMLKNELIIYFPNSGRPGTQRYNTNKIVLKTDLIVFFSRSGKQNHHIHIFSGVCLQEHMQRAICLPVIRSYSHRFSLFAAWTRTTVVQHYSYSIAQGDNITVPHVDRYTATEHDQCILRYAQ